MKKLVPPISSQCRHHNAEFEAKVALEALKGIEPVHAVAARFWVYPTQVSAWKKEVAERLPEFFGRKADDDPAAAAAAKAEQNEFSFNEHESRGYFDKTDRNLFEGQDLDVPTYLRKGIKIAV